MCGAKMLNRVENITNLKQTAKFAIVYEYFDTITHKQFDL